MKRQKDRKTKQQKDKMTKRQKDKKIKKTKRQKDKKTKRQSHVICNRKKLRILCNILKISSNYEILLFWNNISQNMQP